MRRLLWATGIALSVLSACNYDEGQCWIDDEGAGSVGAGGGPIVPGAGGYGNVPPKPQSTTNPPPADCLIVPATACHQKCLDDYENTAVKCAKIQDEAQRKACDSAAHATYTNCRESCQKKEGDCLEACKEQCDRAWEQCRDDCPKGDKGCLGKCSDKYGKCLKECDDRCK